MAQLVLLRFLFWSLGHLASLVSFVFIRGTALLVVALLQALNLPRAAIHTGLARAADLARAGAGWLGEATWDAVVSALSGAAGLGKGAATGAFELAASAGEGALDRAKDVVGQAWDSFPEALDIVREAAGKAAGDLWEHYMDAVSFVRNNF